MSLLLVLFAPSSTNNDCLQVLSLMEPKQDRVYARGHSMSITLFARLVKGSDDEHDPEYVLPAFPLHHELHVQLELRLKRWRPA